MTAVFSASDIALLPLSQSIAFSMIALIPSELPSAVGPATHAVKSSTKAMSPNAAVNLPLYEIRIEEQEQNQ